MAHVTFVHGIANKPPADELLAIWRRALDESVPFGDLGVTASQVYWADLMYETPDHDLAAHEGVLENTVQAIDASGGAPMPTPDTPEEAAFLESLRRRLTTLSDAEIEAQSSAGEVGQASAIAAAGVLERVPLPWFLKRPLMAVLLRDVHHYLFDKEYAPPGKQPVHIQQTIRRRFVDALSAPGITSPHVVVAHSLGSVIAYDCLKRVSGCVAVDGLITIGSPLGLDEVQDKLQPGWSRADGFPRQTVKDRWFNFFDRLDPVCGFDPELANDYRASEASQLIDQVVSNPGAWRHSAVKYLRQPAFATALRSLLRV